MKTHFGVLFDMDGVLVDSNPYHKIAIQEFCKRHGKNLAEEELLKKVYGRTNRDWLTNLFGTLSENDFQRYANEKEALFRELYAPYIKPVIGLLSFVRDLQTHHIPYTISTSAPPANVTFTLHAIGADHLFPVILDETFVTKGKPDPEIYLKSAAAINLAPTQCWVIEDSVSGILAGKSAGCKVAGITTTHSKEEISHADLVFSDFSHLSVENLASRI
ncbi:MAG: HAD family phosphatase [Cyclobacteriaceae bacterium]|jgi:beta-phosphoglucomutase|nr:HAD family phosphatase [Flammeovirgaceae bacterium]MCZ8020931.1 HAD family phosphatase [Cytophagales bacterium]MCZ8329013.1 HAD family phosphatase [Cyclobacteriaceae bacterium]